MHWGGHLDSRQLYWIDLSLLYSRLVQSFAKGRSSEDRLGLQSAPCELEVAQVLVRIVCLVNHDQVFLKSLNAPTATRAYGLTCTSGLLQPVHTFLNLVQTCTVCCALEGILNVSDACGCLKLSIRKLCWASHHNRWLKRVKNNVICTAAHSFVLFLFFLNEVMKLYIFEVDLCIVCQQEKDNKEQRRRIRDEIFCLFVKNETFK